MTRGRKPEPAELKAAKGNPGRRPLKPQRVVGELLKAEIAEKQARSIKYQLTIARLPLACRNVRIGETLLTCGDEGHEVSRWTELLRKLSAAGASFNMLSKQGTSPGPAATLASAAPVSTDGGWTI
jgi:hypothetical protein